MLGWQIGAMARRLNEGGVSESVKSKYQEYALELQEIERVLSEVPFRRIAAGELPFCLVEAFQAARSAIHITTTLPNEARFSVDVERALAEAISRGVSICIDIADRLDDQTSQRRNRQSSAVARLNALVNQSNGKLDIRFLRTTERSVFEICWDEVELVFSNDSPLGSRPNPKQPREFQGFRVSDAVVTGRYVREHMSIGEGEILKRLGRSFSRGDSSRNKSRTRGSRNGRRKARG